MIQVEIRLLDEMIDGEVVNLLRDSGNFQKLQKFEFIVTPLCNDLRLLEICIIQN